MEKAFGFQQKLFILQPKTPAIFSPPPDASYKEVLAALLIWR
jgi:hypothetical protein